MKKVSAHDLAFGIGRKATKEELEELLLRNAGNKKDVEQVRKEIKENLKQRRDKEKPLDNHLRRSSLELLICYPRSM